MSLHSWQKLPRPLMWQDQILFRQLTCQQQTDRHTTHPKLQLQLVVMMLLHMQRPLSGTLQSLPETGVHQCCLPDRYLLEMQTWILLHHMFATAAQLWSPFPSATFSGCWHYLCISATYALVESGAELTKRFVAASMTRLWCCVLGSFHCA